LFSKIGIVIIIIGVFIGVKYSIQHNLISPAMRLVLGYLMGIGLFVTGAMLKKKYESFSAILVSGAMTIFYFVTFIAYAVFGYFPQSLAFVLMFLFTAFTVLASLSYNQVVIAIIGLVGGYAVPFLLSNNSGQVEILFAYTAIINIGVLILSFYKQWRSLYISALFLTWLLLFSTWASAYQYDDFVPYFVFNLVTFLTFYVAFIVQKIHRVQELEAVDVLLFLFSSLSFYAMGVWLILDYYPNNRTFVAMFTLLNAVFHFLVGYYFHLKKAPSQALKYLVLVLALSFATLVIPIQFKGTWITIFWIAEAALLFGFGRTKKMPVYERISYAVVILATFSLLIDWGKGSYSIFDMEDASAYITPFANSLFITGLLYSVAVGAMAYINDKYKETGTLNKVLSFLFNIFSVLILYCTFYREISVFCDMRALHQDPEIYNLYNHYEAYQDLNTFKGVWHIIYSVLFISAYSFLNVKYLKKKLLAELQIGLNFLLLTIFMTLGLYYFSELRERYMEEAQEGGQLSLWFLNIRYVGLLSLVVLGNSIYALSKFLEFKTGARRVLEMLLHLVILWVASSELLHWTDIYESVANYKLGLTILWGGYAILLVVLGIFKRKKYQRISGIILVGFTLLKLFFYDTTHLDTLHKTIVFVLLGILLLVASFLYNKYTKEIEGEQK
jgi:membrane protein-like protein